MIAIEKVQEYVLRHAADREVVDELEEDWVEKNVKLIEEGETQVEHKMCYQENIYRVVFEGEERYFCVVSSWSNSGYWSDSESYDPEVYEVEPMQVTITQWNMKK